MQDRTVYLLCAGLVFFTLLIVATAAFFPANKKLYAPFAGILGNFSGALFTWLQEGKN